MSSTTNQGRVPRQLRSRGSGVVPARICDDVATLSSIATVLPVLGYRLVFEADWTPAVWTLQLSLDPVELEDLLVVDGDVVADLQDSLTFADTVF